MENEFNQDHGFAWITKGRMIENYIPVDAIKKAIRKVHRNVSEFLYHNNKRYGRLLCYQIDDQKEEKTANKVKVARVIVKEPANLDILDLEEMVKKTIDFIKEANALM